MVFTLLINPCPPPQLDYLQINENCWCETSKCSWQIISEPLLLLNTVSPIKHSPPILFQTARTLCKYLREYIFCDTDFVVTWYSHLLLDSLLFLKVNPGKVPFSVGLGPTTEERCSEFLESLFWIEHTLFQWNNILYLVTINFVLYDVNIVNIPLCAHRAELLTIVPLSSSLSRLSILFMKHITDIEFLTLTNYPPIIQRDTLRTISGNSN